MSRRSLPVLVLGLAGLVLVAALWLLRTSPGAEAERERSTLARGVGIDETSPPPAPRFQVDALVTRETDAPVVVDVAAVLEPVRQVTLAAEVAGKVVELAVQEHDHVAVGDALVRLDPDLPEAALERARASLVRGEASARLARAELGRQQDLSRRGVASAAELERTESQAETTAAEVAELRAALREAETRLTKTTLRAPFGGIVTDLDLDPGAYVQPGSPVATLVDLSEIEVEVGVDDRQVLALVAGDPVRVRVDVYPGEWFEGRIVSVGRAPDPQTRKYPVPVRLPNPDERLLPGMLGSVRFELAASGQTLRIPRRAVLREFELDYVYVLEDANGDRATARRRRITTRGVPFRPDLVEVATGLEAGERIAVSAVRELREGLPVGFLDEGPHP
jgi:membrane fusion protein (multidrug efflux system)